MEKIHFADKLIEPILSGQKTSTWKINEEVHFRRSNTDNVKKDDLISLCNNEGEEFAQGKILDIKEMMFEELTDEDKKEHEKFSSDEEMYREYSNYYKIKIGPKSKMKIIRFNLI